MSILRVQLGSWQDLGQAQAAGQPGDALTGRVVMRPSLPAGSAVIDSDSGVHQVDIEHDETATAPWTYDLLDPTDTNPSGWGWVITLSPTAGGTMTAVLTPDRISALPQVGGIRTADLTHFVGLGTVLPIGGLVAPGLGITAAEVDADGHLILTMTDGSTINASQATTLATSAQGAKAETAVQLGGDLAGSSTNPQVTSGAHHTHTADQMVAGQLDGQRLPDGLAYVTGATPGTLTLTWHQFTIDAYPTNYPAGYAAPTPVWVPNTATIARQS